MALCAGLLLGLLYVGLHWYCENKRAARLANRAGISTDEFARRIGAGHPPADDSVVIIRKAFAEGLRIPEDRVWPDDRFCVEYRLPLDVILLNEYDELVFASIRRQLHERRLAAWMPHDMRSWQTVGDAVAALSEHLRNVASTTAKTNSRRSGDAESVGSPAK